MRRPVVVIFGIAPRRDGSPSAEMRRRVAAALAFGQPRAALFVPTGGPVRHPVPEASIMAGLLRAAGVPDADILAEVSSRNTLRSALACAVLLGGRPELGPVWAASSAYHLPRCLMLLHLAGIRARPCPAPPRYPGERPGLRRMLSWARECAAIMVDLPTMLAVRARLAKA